eukprot:5534253-Prymnesium_polylepis.2
MYACMSAATGRIGVGIVTLFASSCTCLRRALWDCTAGWAGSGFWVRSGSGSKCRGQRAQKAEGGGGAWHVAVRNRMPPEWWTLAN